jgi:hypothetical protein
MLPKYIYRYIRIDNENTYSSAKVLLIKDMLGNAYTIDKPNKSYKQMLSELHDSGCEMFMRIKLDRVPAFTKYIDETLDDMLSEFALEYADESGDREQLMGNMLLKLKEKFNITRRR